MIVKRLIISIWLSIFGTLFFVTPIFAAPLLANYYLGELNKSEADLKLLEKNDLLILTPAQILTNSQITARFKTNNPKLKIFAYVPIQSYNEQYWPTHDPVFKQLQINSDWWMKDKSGQTVYYVPGLKMLNLKSGWADYLANFVVNKIVAIPQVDGVFFDMVDDDISWVNNGQIDIDDDGQTDSADKINTIWKSRVAYFLSRAHARLGSIPVIINGSNWSDYQSHVNGRMFESFPNGIVNNLRWQDTMNVIEQNRSKNLSSQLYIFNTNTDNTGNHLNYRQVRYGLGSSLLADGVYFSFDYGYASHSQIWWYDEYNVNLGAPVGSPQLVASNGALSAKTGSYQPQVWRRDFQNGIALVNSTNGARSISLGEDYERIRGTQDPGVNSGGITNKITIAGEDGIILLKTKQTVDDVLYNNGDFLRFYNYKGARVRNGFYAYDDSVAGGAQILRTDLDGENGKEKIVITGKKMEIFNSGGDRWYNEYPLGANIKGAVSLAAGKLYGNSESDIVVYNRSAGPLNLLKYYGETLLANIKLTEFKNSTVGIAIGNTDGGVKSELVLSVVKKGRASEIVAYDWKIKTVRYRFFPYGKSFVGALSATVGDVDGDGKDEIITLGKFGGQNLVRVFRAGGKKLSEFKLVATVTGGAMSLGASDVNYDGKDEIVVMSR